MSKNNILSHPNKLTGVGKLTGGIGGNITITTRTAGNLNYIYNTVSVGYTDTYNKEISCSINDLSDYALRKYVEYYFVDTTIDIKRLMNAFPDDEKLKDEMFPLIFGANGEKL